MTQKQSLMSRKCYYLNVITKINNIVNLHEYQKIEHPNKDQQIVNVKDIVIVQEDKMPRSAWKVGIVEQVIKGLMTIFEEQ